MGGISLKLMQDMVVTKELAYYQATTWNHGASLSGHQGTQPDQRFNPIQNCCWPSLLFPQPDFNSALYAPPQLQENVPSRAQNILTRDFFSHLHFLRDGRLSLGDELLVINGHLLVGLSHEEAVAILRSATGMVQLVVASKVGSLVIFYIYF